MGAGAETGFIPPSLMLDLNYISEERFYEQSNNKSAAQRPKNCKRDISTSRVYVYLKNNITKKYCKKHF